MLRIVCCLRQQKGKLPLQSVPFPTKPLLQVQLKPPRVSEQKEFTWHIVPTQHSSSSILEKTNGISVFSELANQIHELYGGFGRKKCINI